MRGLMRNKRPIFYKNYLSTDYVEKNGMKTGGRKVNYSDVKVVYGTVSTPTGTTVLEMFGKDENYDKVVVIDMPNIDISENSVLWLDKAYAEKSSYDYVVKRIIRNHNFLTIGVRKVDVSYAEANTGSTNN